MPLAGLGGVRGFGGFVRFSGGSDQDDEFALPGPTFEVGGDRGGGAAQPFLEFLGQFTAGDDLTLRAGRGDFLEQAGHAVGGLVDAQGAG